MNILQPKPAAMCRDSIERAEELMDYQLYTETSAAMVHKLIDDPEAAKWQMLNSDTTRTVFVILMQARFKETDSMHGAEYSRYMSLQTQLSNQLIVMNQTYVKDRIGIVKKEIKRWLDCLKEDVTKCIGERNDAVYHLYQIIREAAEALRDLPKELPQLIEAMNKMKTEAEFFLKDDIEGKCLKKEHEKLLQKRIHTYPESLLNELSNCYLTLSSRQNAENKNDDKETIRLLKEEIKRFTLIEKQRNQLKEELISGIKNYSDVSEDAARVKVSGWLSSDTLKIKNDDARLIVYIIRNNRLDEGLTFNIEDADLLLRQLVQTSLHLRDPEDIAFIYAFSHNYSIPKMQELCKKALSVFMKKRNTEFDQTMVATEIVKNDEKYQEGISGDETQFLDFICDYAPKLGQMHNTAFSYFRDYYDMFFEASTDDKEINKKKTTYILSQPRTAELAENEKKAELRKELNIVSAETKKAFDTLNENIRRKIDDFQTDSSIGKNEMLILKLIENALPSTDSLGKIRRREIDVTRKSLILMFILVEASGTENMFEDSYEGLNTALYESGFSELDPRQPFDWFILYFLRLQNPDDLDIIAHLSRVAEFMLSFLKEDKRNILFQA